MRKDSLYEITWRYVTLCVVWHYALCDIIRYETLHVMWHSTLYDVMINSVTLCDVIWHFLPWERVGCRCWRSRQLRHMVWSCWCSWRRQPTCLQILFRQSEVKWRKIKYGDQHGRSSMTSDTILWSFFCSLINCESDFFYFKVSTSPKTLSIKRLNRQI